MLASHLPQQSRLSPRFGTTYEVAGIKYKEVKVDDFYTRPGAAITNPTERQAVLDVLTDQLECKNGLVRDTFCAKDPEYKEVFESHYGYYTLYFNERLDRFFTGPKPKQFMAWYSERTRTEGRVPDSKQKEALKSQEDQLQAELLAEAPTKRLFLEVERNTGRHGHDFKLTNVTIEDIPQQTPPAKP